MGFGRGFYTLAVSIAAQRLFTRCRQDNKTCHDFLLPSLPDATNLIVQKLQQLDKRLDCLIRDLHVYQLYGHQKSWSCREDAQGLSNLDIMSSIDRKSGDFKVLLCSAKVLDHSPRKVSKDLKHVTECINKFDKDYYKSTENAIRHLMDLIPRTDAKEELSFRCDEVVDGFPASHIAYLNGDKEAALSLWAESIARSGSNVDILGRTFPQLVAEAGDAELLERVGTLSLGNISPDKRGFSLLALAIVSDNETIVKRILNENIAFLNFTEEMQRAIRTNRPQMASQIFPTRLGPPPTVFEGTNVFNNVAIKCEHKIIQPATLILTQQDSSWSGLDFTDDSAWDYDVSIQHSSDCSQIFDNDMFLESTGTWQSESVSEMPIEGGSYDFDMCLAYPGTLDLYNPNSTEICPYYSHG